METFAVLTFCRGDRPKFYEHCLWQVERFHFNAPHIKVVHQPDSETCDICHRVKRGINIARSEGFTWIVIVESDDFYPVDYLDRIIPYMKDFDFIGDAESIYYNIRRRTFTELKHPGRASLFTTSFRISALDDFQWPEMTTPFLDMPLWQHARDKYRMKFIDTGTIGIKHGVGKVGGKGHAMNLKNHDPELKWLSKFVDADAMEFYKNLEL